MTFFDENEKERYRRHFSLKEMGEEGQEALKKAKILCIGAGGLGSAALPYLAAAGIGEIAIVDPDSIELTNLHRQVIYTELDLGKKKVEVAAAKLKQINSTVKVNASPIFFNETNAEEFISKYDIIFDGTDNFFTRYLINDVCQALQKPFVYGAINEFKANCTFFDFSQNGPCYRCIFEKLPTAFESPNCTEAGVLGVLPGVLGTLQATEVIKWITKIGDNLMGRWLTFDLLKMQFHEIAYSKNSSCLACANKENWKNRDRPLPVCFVSEIDYQEISESIFLLDVREADEREKKLGDNWIPFSQFAQRLHEIPKHYSIVTYCSSGKRSKIAAAQLIQAGFSSVKSLSKGINELKNFLK